MFLGFFSEEREYEKALRRQGVFWNGLTHGDALRCRCSPAAGTIYRFRQDPVPGKGNRGHYCFFRNIRTFPEHRMLADPELGAYLRPCRRQVPSTWDELSRYPQRSWKAQGKKKKQWM